MSALPPPIFVEPIITLRPGAFQVVTMRCRICQRERNVHHQPVRPTCEETFVCGVCIETYASRTGAVRGASRRDRFNLLKVKALSETLRWSSINGPLPTG